jgi:hypothetical protein
MLLDRARRVLGIAASVPLAAVAAGLSFMRRARVFHPSGIVCRAEIEPVGGAPDGAAARVRGSGIVRLSSAWWKFGQWPDVLGCAVRFSEDPLTTTPKASDQDLLFATILRPWTMALAPFMTAYRDFLANRYYAVSPFDVAELGRVEWRLSPESPERFVGSRDARLAAAIASGKASFLLEWAPYRAPWQLVTRAGERQFSPLARVRLVGVLPLDQATLRFDPFHAGRGLHPVGFVHALRLLTYPASQLARPARSH